MFLCFWQALASLGAMLYKVLSLPCDWRTHGSNTGLGHTKPGHEP